MTFPTATIHRLLTLPAALALAVLSLGGCDKKPADSTATQVAAKVNGTEITVHQVNYYLSKAGNVPSDKIDQARKLVLDRLVEQELFAVKAVEEKLDSAPGTLMALEMAKREVLSRAYIEHQITSGEKMQRSEIAKYYWAHPELFSERKIYSLKEASFAIGSANPDVVQALINERKSFDQIADYLTSQNVKFAKSAALRAAEKLPMELLQQLHKAKVGEIIFFTDAQAHNVILVAATRSMPVDETTASPAIQNFLFTKHANEVKEKQLKALKEKAKIEYVGSFAILAKSPATPTVGTSPPVSSATAQPPTGTTTGSSAPNVTAPPTNGPIKLAPLPHEDPNAGGVQLPNPNK